MDNPNLPTKTGKSLHWAWFLLLAVIAVGGYWLFRPTKGPKEASITTPKPIPKSGHRLTLPIVISTAGQTINAAQIFLKFDPKAVQVESIDKEGSFFTVWVKDQPSYSNSSGKISFAGGIFNPGFQGEQTVGNVTLIAKRAIRTELTFLGGTSVLLNDGKGTAIPLHLKPIEVNIP